MKILCTEILKCFLPFTPDGREKKVLEGKPRRGRRMGEKNCGRKQKRVEYYVEGGQGSNMDAR